MNSNEIIAYQREIINTILIEEYIAEENNKKLELLEEILSRKSHLFTKVQRNILLKAKEEITYVRDEGCYECWITSESFLEELTDEEKAEMIEILGTSPLIIDLAYIQLKKLEDKFLLRKAI
jgi:hypothetical protein